MADNNTLRKDLGPVTAYAIAVEAGFEGTQEEWVRRISSSVDQQSFNTLAASVASGDATLSDKIDTDIGTEAAARSAADTAEATARETADTAQSGRIDALSETVAGNDTTLRNILVHKPADSYSPDGANGQVLMTHGDGTTEWSSFGQPTPEQAAAAVSAWLDAHPEATTTVVDGSITKAKLDSELKDRVNLATNSLAPIFQQATANDPGTYVSIADRLYYLPEGHTADVTWENTTKVEVQTTGEIKKLSADVTGLKSAIIDLEDTQTITCFDESTISGTRSYSAQVNIPAGTYHLDIESIVSSDTQYTTSRIIFLYSSGSKSIDVARNTVISQDITFTSDVNKISFYGAHSYSDSANVTFTVNNVLLYKITQLYNRLADLDKTASRIGSINFGTVSEFLFDGYGKLYSDNFEQGYMSNGTGWTSTGSGDSLKYITFRNHSKLHKGTKVNVDCATLYCAIDLYADDNWSASSVRLDHVDYMQSTSYKLPSDGYLCLTVSTSNKYASRVAITPSDFDENIKIYPKTETGAEINAVLYEGEKIDVERHYCQVESYMTMTHVSTRSMQGGACFGNYFFQFMDKFSGCAIYDLSNKSLIQLISLTEVDTYHCNNANFGTEFYDAGDAFPLLYVSMENVDEHKVNVYRVTNVNDAYGLTLVQTITWDAPSINSVYYPNAVIDTDNNHIIQIGYSTNSYQASNSNKIKVNIFDLPLLSAGDITLTDSDKIDSFILPSLQATQGAVCHNGKIIQAYGLTSDYQIRVIDLTKKQFVTKIDLTDATISAVVGTEQEAVFIYDGNIFCSNVNKNIWKLIV